MQESNFPLKFVKPLYYQILFNHFSAYIEDEEEHDLKDIIQGNKELGQLFERDNTTFNVLQVY